MYPFLRARSYFAQSFLFILDTLSIKGFIIEADLFSAPILSNSNLLKACFNVGLISSSLDEIGRIVLSMILSLGLIFGNISSISSMLTFLADLDLFGLKSRSNSSYSSKLSLLPLIPSSSFGIFLWCSEGLFPNPAPIARSLYLSKAGLRPLKF